ncbi:MAG: hypothetical protein ACNS62_02110 [Candidatus Cyclobacteriaceae bacterium M3_2C_046]
MVNKKKLLKIVIPIHLYAGLFSAGFLGIAGLTAINFQHNWLSRDPVDTLFTTQPVSIDTRLSQADLARDVIAQLDIIGHTPGWDFRRDSLAQTFKFVVHRPARRINITLQYPDQQAVVEEIRYGAGAVLEAMHKSTMIELKDPTLILWAIFAQFSAISALVAVISSAFLWKIKAVKFTWEWYMICATGSLALMYIMYLWLIG